MSHLFNSQNLLADEVLTYDRGGEQAQQIYPQINLKPL